MVDLFSGSAHVAIFDTGLVIQIQSIRIEPGTRLANTMCFPLSRLLSLRLSEILRNWDPSSVKFVVNNDFFQDHVVFFFAWQIHVSMILLIIGQAKHLPNQSDCHICF